jgi:hypothetical protein
MCWSYKGIDYYYAFEFKFPVSNSVDRLFRIVTSNYREEAANFTGLCLDNELEIISNEEIQFMAFYDIIDKMITYTLADERAYAEAHSGQMPSPLMKVEDGDFLKKFEERKKSSKSLDYYKQLKKFFERPERICEDIPDEIIINLTDYLNLMYFLLWVNTKRSNIKEMKVFKI